MDLDTRTTEDTATVRDNTDRSFWEEIKDMFTMDDDREMETTDDDFQRLIEKTSAMVIR